MGSRMARETPAYAVGTDWRSLVEGKEADDARWHLEHLGIAHFVLYHPLKSRFHWDHSSDRKMRLATVDSYERYSHWGGMKSQKEFLGELSGADTGASVASSSRDATDVLVCVLSTHGGGSIVAKEKAIDRIAETGEMYAELACFSTINDGLPLGLENLMRGLDAYIPKSGPRLVIRSRSSEGESILREVGSVIS